MPFRKRTIREQAKMARELKRLKQLENNLRYGGQRLCVAKLPDFAGGTVSAALRLERIVVLRRHSEINDQLAVIAVQL
jgi:hypothetical protein